MICIVGGGPVGCYVSYLIAKEGKKVVLFEEHEEVGRPVQCTGILSSSFSNHWDIDEDYLVNTVTKTEIISPKGKKLSLKLKPNYVVDRTKFDKYFENLAKKSGVKIRYGYKLVDVKKRGDYWKLKFDKKSSFECETLVGADGPFSQVARSLGMMHKRKYFQGFQVRCYWDNKNIVQFFPFLGGFGWCVPENRETVRIGVACYSSAKKNLEKILNNYFKKARVIEYQGGLIPLYNPKQKIKKGSAYLVGDAAGQVKATSGGGIIQGLLGAECLARSLLEKKTYAHLLKKNIGTKLWTHSLMRHIMDKFTETDWERFISDFSDDNVIQVLQTVPRDQPVRLIAKLLAAKPSISLYVSKFLS